MPMNFGNTAIQNTGLVAWDGAAGDPVDVRKHIKFAWSFKVTTDLTVDTVFNVMSAPPDAVDPCIPGAFVPVAEVPTCVSFFGAVGGPQAAILLPAGTVAGSICSATIPCKPDAFVSLAAGSGDTANVRAVAILSGPM